MRFLIKLSVITAAMVLFGAGAAWASPWEGPDGSYRHTCKNIKMHDDSLRARCQDRDGNWHDAQLDHVERCISDITNVNGRLSCNQEAREALRGDVPPGNYAQSCRDIHVDGNRLRARCQTREARWVDAWLDDFRRCRDIGNDNGRLVCGGYGGNDRDRDRDHDRDRDKDRDRDGDRVPRGSYTQSCRDIAVRGDTLLARCEERDGEWRTASLEDFQRCGGEIVNDNGRLDCTRRSGWSAPRGTYTETCRDIYLRGDTMRARCQTSNGQWLWSQLDDWDGCRSGIVNIEGQLRCNR
jgi:CVNH domain